MDYKVEENIQYQSNYTQLKSIGFIIKQQLLLYRGKYNINTLYPIVLLTSRALFDRVFFFNYYKVMNVEDLDSSQTTTSIYNVRKSIN